MVHRPEVIGWAVRGGNEKVYGNWDAAKCGEGYNEEKREKKLLGRAREERRKAKFVFVLAGGGRSGGECDQSATLTGLSA